MITRRIRLTPIGNRTLILQSVTSDVIDRAIRTMTEEEIHALRRVKRTSLENNIIRSVCLCLYLSVYLPVCPHLAVRPALPVF